jgi:hypothetical protein
VSILPLVEQNCKNNFETLLGNVKLKIKLFSYLVGEDFLNKLPEEDSPPPFLTLP